MTLDEVIARFCAQQRDWLRLELESSERQDALESNSNNSLNNNSHKAKRASSDVDDRPRTQVLHHLEVDDYSVGLYGRTVVRLILGTGAILPSHRFTTGDEVEIRSKTGSKSQSPAGVVSQVTEESISVALFSSTTKASRGHSSTNNNNNDEEETPLGAPPFSLLPKSSTEVHRKLVAALEELERQGIGHPIAGRIIQALFEVPPQVRMNTPESDSATLAPPSSTHMDASGLDRSQREAIAFALEENRPIAMIHGPPGTGKTTTVVALIQQAVRRNGWKVLVTAPSNVAVDNVLSRLVKKPPPPSGSSTTTFTSVGSENESASSNPQPTSKAKRRQNQNKTVTASPVLKVVRLGHPARLQPEILPYSLEALVQASEGTEIVRDVRAELQGFLQYLGSNAKDYNKRHMAYREIKNLRQEIRTREERVVQDLLGSAEVVLATCVGAANRLLRDLTFDLVVIDEAAQALEAACWIPALVARRKLVLAGDHCQLPPTIKCHHPEALKGLSQTMFERVIDLYGDRNNNGLGQVSRMLQVQYRMNQQIADWASQALYGGRLLTDDSVRSRTLAQLTGAVDDEIANMPLLLIDTAGCGFHEAENAAGSRLNTGEAELVAGHAKKLIDLGLKPEQIAIISPYNGQVEVLKSLLLPAYPKLEIRSVDGFQGGEREAVVLSLVRSSDHGGIGFLSDDRRLNVAVTRAKRHCCVICDSETVSQSPFIKELILWITEHGEQRAAFEVLAESNASAFENDLIQAELELARLDVYSDKKNPREKDVVRAEPEASRIREDVEKRIRDFARNGDPGSELVFSTELSKYDRKCIHELAEEVGLSHMSQGVEGVDRRITLRKPEIDATGSAPTGTELPVVASDASEGPPPNEMQPPTMLTHESEDLAESDEVKGTLASRESDPVRSVDDSEDNQGAEQTGLVRSVFAALPIEDEDVDAEEEPELSMNAVLGNLARERALRERQLQGNAQLAGPANNPSTGRTKQQKLGGSRKPPTKKEDDNGEQLDDMAFLDAQIDKVQNSHGRTITAKGANYKTIINGILLSRPQEEEKKRNPRASSTLQAKLKQAQDSRRSKTKKKG